MKRKKIIDFLNLGIKAFFFRKKTPWIIVHFTIQMNNKILVLFILYSNSSKCDICVSLKMKISYNIYFLCLVYD